MDGDARKALNYLELLNDMADTVNGENTLIDICWQPFLAKRWPVLIISDAYYDLDFRHFINLSVVQIRMLVCIGMPVLSQRVAIRSM